MVKVIKLFRRIATGVFEKLLHSQSVSLQHVGSQTGHRKGRRSSALLNSVVKIFRIDCHWVFLLLGFFGFILSTAKIVKSSFTTREKTETLNLYG